MQELIKIDSAPVKLVVNFDELKTALSIELEKYNVVVTSDTVADAKKLATELNKTAAEIGRRRKEEVAEISEPIRQFDDHMKELECMCKDGRQNLLDQVKTFEDETRELVSNKLREARDQLWGKHEVQQEFQNAQYDDLILLTSVTKTGSLTAKATGTLETRVLADKALQDRTRMRLLELENQSYKSGLSSPLTRDHIAGFLFEGNEKYSTELQRIIDAEIIREKEAQQRMRARMEQEQREKEAREKAEQERIRAEEQHKEDEAERVREREEHEVRTARNQGVATACKDANNARAEAEEKAIDKDIENLSINATHHTATPQITGKVRVTVTAVFSTEVNGTVSDNAIEAELRKVMERAGLSTLKSVTVSREPQAQAS